MKTLLCVVSQAPYANSQSLELLETAMVAAVFDMKVSLLFRGEGLWALLDNQDGALLGQRTLSKVLLALPDYDINDIFVCSESANDKRIDTSHLTLPVKQLNTTEQAQLISQQDVVMGAQG